MRDGDRVYAEIKAVGIASDGKATGLLAPSVEGEELALRRAYDAAEVEPPRSACSRRTAPAHRSVTRPSSHALARVFGAPASRPSRRALGHRQVDDQPTCSRPSGVAGLIKAALALHHKVLPPTLHCEPRPNPALDRTPVLHQHRHPALGPRRDASRAGPA